MASAASTLERGSSVMARQSSDVRKIAGFMAFAVIFALVGHQVSLRKAVNPLGDAKIVLGGTLATVLLALLAEVGEGGATFAVGLSELALLSSVLINGRGVFSAVSRNTGGPRIAPTTTPVAYPAPTKKKG